MIDLNDYIAVGQNAIARRVVQQSDASDNYDNDFKSLLATPRLIHWAIDAFCAYGTDKPRNDGDGTCFGHRFDRP